MGALTQYSKIRKSSKLAMRKVMIFSVLKRPGRIPGDFPHIPVEVFEITCITPVKGILRVFDNDGSPRFWLFHDGIDFFL
jgi:hypothetical protein